MADQLEVCAQCLRNGELNDALEALNQLQADLQQQLDEMELLEEAMEQLRLARDQMNCPLCQGAGCAACQGDKPGFGMGEGRGQGDRPEERHETATSDSQVAGQVTKGAGMAVGVISAG